MAFFSRTRNFNKNEKKKANFVKIKIIWTKLTQGTAAIWQQNSTGEGTNANEFILVRSYYSADKKKSSYSHIHLDQSTLI